jgi:hypothetical protein
MTEPSSGWQRVRRTLATALRAMAGPTLACPTTAFAPRPPIAGLDVCPRCGRGAVTLLHREPAGEHTCALSLWCGECSAWRVAIATNTQADDLDAALASRRLAMERELARLEAERMADELEIFVRALSDDLIDAGDFAR